MTFSQDSLLEAIETSQFLLPDLPGRVEWLAFPGLRGRITAVSDFFANMVGVSRLRGVEIEQRIGQVCDLFTSQGKEFSWSVGPKSKPGNLARRLQAAGLDKTVEEAGMVLVGLDVSWRVNPNVRVREAIPDDLDVASRLLAPALGITVDGARVVTEALLLSSSPLRRRVYLAFLQGVEEPVAYASAVYLPNQPIMVLFCAGTLEEYRGHGIYTSLVARRLADARQDGIQAAVIQAVRGTSAPICRKLGFVEIGSLEWYTWFLPED